MTFHISKFQIKAQEKGDFKKICNTEIEFEFGTIY